MSKLSMTERLRLLARGDNLDLADIVCADAIAHIAALEAALQNIRLQNVEPYCREIARAALRGAAQSVAATPQPSIDAVARLSRDLLIELDTYWSGISGPSLSGIMLDWRNKYRILLEDGGAAQGSGSRDEVRNAALEEAALYHDKAAADCRAIALCNRDNDLGADSETHAIDHEIAAKDVREMKSLELPPGMHKFTDANGPDE